MMPFSILNNSHLQKNITAVSRNNKLPPRDKTKDHASQRINAITNLFFIFTQTTISYKASIVDHSKLSKTGTEQLPKASEDVHASSPPSHFCHLPKAFLRLIILTEPYLSCECTK